MAHSCIWWEDKFSCSEGEGERVRERGLCGADRVLAGRTLGGLSPLRLSSLPSRPPSLLGEVLCPEEHSKGSSPFSQCRSCHCICSACAPVLVYRSVHGRISRDASGTLSSCASCCMSVSVRSIRVLTRVTFFPFLSSLSVTLLFCSKWGINQENRFTFPP